MRPFSEIAAGFAHDETNVEFVSLDFNSFGDDGVAALSQIRVLPNCTCLAIACQPLAPST
jgi:hypothetical protein